MSDAYAMALQSRRGEGLDPSLTAPPLPGAEQMSTPPPTPQPATMSPASGAAVPAAPMAQAQPPPSMGNPQEVNDMTSAVTGGANENEYQMLKGMKPRSLGERAKMDALKTQFEPARQGK